MPIDLALINPTTNARMPLATNDATAMTISDGAHGDEQLTATLPRTLVEGMAVYEAPIPHVVASEHGVPIATYRLEQPAISDAQTQLTALGASRAFSDISLTGFWSTTAYDGWRDATADDPGQLGAVAEQRYQIDNENRVFISPQKGASYTINDQGRAIWFVPSGASPAALGVQFDAAHSLPLGWQVALYRYSAAGAFLGTVWSANAVGGPATQSVWATFASTDILVFAVLWNGGGTTAYAPETGGGFLKITNLRTVGATASAVSTTLTVARTNGAGVTLTVGTTVRMYVGQRLFLAGGGNTESLVITSITSGTQLVATVVNAPGGGYPIGTGVFAHVIYADEVVRALLTATVALNPTQLRSDVGQIVQAPIDLTDLAYEDAQADAILSDLEQRTSYRWALRNRILSFAPVGTNAQTWYVDAATYEVQRALDELANQAYAIYQTGAGDTVRGSVANATSSQQRFGLIRQRGITADTTNATLAATQRDRELAATATPTPQTAITFDAIYTAQGARVPPWMVHAGDTLIIRNLPPQAALSRDPIRALLLTRREVGLDDASITVEAQPLETIERLIGKTTA